MAEAGLSEPGIADARPGGRGAWRGYSTADERPPLGSRLVLSSVFTAALGSFLVLRRRAGRPLPERIGTRDLMLVAGASFKFGRLLAKSKVSAPLRAPFTVLEGDGDAPGEVAERPRGDGPRAALGELLTCPFCLGMWSTSALVVGLVTAPRETRVIASILSALGVSDLLQAAYAALNADSED